MGIYFKDVGIDAEIESSTGPGYATCSATRRSSAASGPYHLLAAGGGLDAYSYYSKGTGHIFEDEFIEKNYLALTQTVNPEERQRLARAVGDHVYDEFADIPLIWFYNEVAVNPKIVADWQYPGIGAGRSTHFHTLKAVK